MLNSYCALPELICREAFLNKRTGLADWYLETASKKALMATRQKHHEIIKWQADCRPEQEYVPGALRADTSQTMLASRAAPAESVDPTDPPCLVLQPGLSP